MGSVEFAVCVHEVKSVYWLVDFLPPEHFGYSCAEKEILKFSRSWGLSVSLTAVTGEG